MTNTLLLKEPLSLRLYTPAPAAKFKYYVIEKDHSLSIGCKRHFHLFFVMEGKIRVSCNEFIDRRFSINECAIVPISADFSCKALMDSKVMIFTFDEFSHFCDPLFMDDLLQISRKINYNFDPTPIRKPLHSILESLAYCIVTKADQPLLHEIKHEELFIVLQWFYSRQETTELLYPLLGRSFEFRKAVLRNYRKVKNIDELAELLGVNVRTFCRQFKQEFRMAPYQWLLNQKAKHIQYSLAETQQSLREIRQQHGFTFAAHFTRFCREQFSCTPTKLEQNLRYKEFIDD